ncbi:Ms5788A family Cys-rich leader peptide [Catellatospora bangladeshensis]
MCSLPDQHGSGSPSGRPIPDGGRHIPEMRTVLVGSPTMSPLLTKRRAVDLCRVATCLCCPVL